MLRTLLKSLKTPEETTAEERRVDPAPAAAPLAEPAAYPLQSPLMAAAAHAAFAAVEAAENAGTQAETIARAQSQLAQDPRHLEALLTLAGLLRFTDAAYAGELHARAVALQPSSAVLQYELSHSLQRQLRMAEATAAMRLALAAEPTSDRYRFALAIQLLLQGQYREGFLHFRARNDAREQRRKHPWLSALPAWGGEPLAGRRLLVWTDWGGLGDELILARYLTEIHRRFRPAELYVNCSAQNRRLFARVEGVTDAFSEGGVFEVDCHAALLDLPCIFATGLDNIPATVPYLNPDPQDIEWWKNRLAPLPGLKIGLCWGSGFWGQGAQLDSARRNKSMPLAQLADLGGIAGVSLVSLQKGVALPELAASGLPIHDFDAELNDMADTAALAANLDLIITVDTSVSHLAGGLNRPTLVLLPYSSGSFWLLETERSPWYPGVRLLRHGHAGDWAGVAARAVELVRACAARGAVDVFA